MNSSNLICFVTDLYFQSCSDWKLMIFFCQFFFYLSAQRCTCTSVILYPLPSCSQEKLQTLELPLAPDENSPSILIFTISSTICVCIVQALMWSLNERMLVHSTSSAVLVNTCGTSPCRWKHITVCEILSPTISCSRSPLLSHFLSISDTLQFFLSFFFLQHICGLRQRSFCLDKAKD